MHTSILYTGEHLYTALEVVRSLKKFQLNNLVPDLSTRHKWILEEAQEQSITDEKIQNPINWLLYNISHIRIIPFLPNQIF